MSCTLSRMRHLEIKARLLLHIDDLAEAQDDRLLALVHHEDGGQADDDDRRPAR